MARRDVETQKALAGQSGDETAQLKQAAASAIELRQSLQKEHDRAEALASELAIARRDVETQKALARGSARRDRAAHAGWRKRRAELRQSLQNERDRAEALDRELAMARRDVETQVALTSKAEDEAAQVKRASESATAELRQFLQKERDRVEALVNDLAMARREVETQAALASKAGKDAVENKRTAENATAELLQQRDRAEALASELVMVRRDIDTRVRVKRATGDEVMKLKQPTESPAAEPRQSVMEHGSIDHESGRSSSGAVERAANQSDRVPQAAKAIATEPLAATGAPSGPEAARLLARASNLLGQGNIGAARIVLERAAETGNAQASFMLAETYDPVILSKWGTYGTRGEATKARELYAKAHAGGVQEAKDRLNALRQE